MNEKLIGDLFAAAMRRMTGSTSKEFSQKFAEEIVRECAKVLTQHGAYFSGDGEPYHYAASLIEEHFGVEE